MNRRFFLKNILGAGVVASTNPVHFLAPPNGWRRMDSGLFALNNSGNTSGWHSKTAQEIMDDVRDILSKMDPMLAIGKDLDDLSRVYGLQRTVFPLETDASFRRRHLAFIGDIIT